MSLYYYSSTCRVEVAWWENDGQQNFTEHSLSKNQGGVQYAISADMDSDGDIDIVATSRSSGLLGWMENDGNQIFTRRPIISNYYKFNGIRIAPPHDIDNNLDIAVTQNNTRSVQMVLNNGTGVRHPRHHGADPCAPASRLDPVLRLHDDLSLRLSVERGRPRDRSMIGT